LSVEGTSSISGRAGEVSRVLDAVALGDARAAKEVPPLVQAELRKLAAHKMASEPPGQTLQPTALPGWD
jgi:hypothetical protein